MSEMTVVVYQKGKKMSVRVPRSGTVAMVKQEVQKSHRRDLTRLSFRGVEVHSEDFLVSTVGMDESNNELHGELLVTVEDRLCDVEYSVSGFMFETLQDLAERFSREFHRVLHRGFQFLHKSSNNPVDLSQTLHSAGFRSGLAVVFEPPAYSVVVEFTNIGEAPKIETVQVRDSNLVRDVLGKFETSAMVAVGEDAKLLKGANMLDNDRMLYAYEIRDGERLTIQVDDDVQSFDYSCADCGSTLKLKKKDAIRCKECGHRILFKERSGPLGSEYLAR